MKELSELRDELIKMSDDDANNCKELLESHDGDLDSRRAVMDYYYYAGKRCAFMEVLKIISSKIDLMLDEMAKENEK